MHWVEWEYLFQNFGEVQKIKIDICLDQIIDQKCLVASQIE